MSINSENESSAKFAEEEKNNNSSNCCCCSGSDSEDSKSGACCSDDECCADDCCCDDDCADEHNLSEKKVIEIDYLYLDLSVCDRCVGTDERVFRAVEKLHDVMDDAGYEMVVNRIEIKTEEDAQKYEFVSSPTVRVCGVDICPEVIENECDCCRTLSSYDVYCRQFSFNDKLYEVPPHAYIVKRILEIVFGGEKPASAPYVMPENIRGFLREKY